MLPSLSLWDKPKCAGGVRKGTIPHIVSGACPEFVELDPKQLLEWASRADDPVSGEPVDWLDVALPKRDIVRVDDPYRSTVQEFRLTDIIERAGSPIVEAKAEPLVTVLRDIGHMRLSEGNGYPLRYVLGGEKLTISEYWTTFVDPLLTEFGVTWIDLGTVDTDAQFTLQWERWSPLKLLQWFKESTGLELDFRRNGDTSYLVDLVEEVGSDADEVLLGERKNLLSLTRTRSPERLANVVAPFGAKLNGTSERHTIAYARFLVDSEPATDRIAVSCPLTGLDVVRFDGQYAGPNARRILCPDNTLQTVVDSDVAGQWIEMESGGGSHIAAGDYFEFRADDDGNVCDELEDPDTPEHGRVVSELLLDQFRGEAVHGNNWWGETWAGKTQAVYWCRLVANTARASTSWALKDLPAGVVVDATALLWPYESPPTSAVDVTVGGTSSGGGTLTVTTSVGYGVGTFLTDQPFLLWMQGTIPTGWTDPNASDAYKQLRLEQRPRNTYIGTAVQCDAAGAFTEGRLALKNIPETEGEPYRIWPGDVIQSVANPTEFDVVMSATQADGSGNATVVLSSVVAWTVADGDDVNIIQAGYGGGFAPESLVDNCVVVLAPRTSDHADKSKVELPTVTIRRTGEQELLAQMRCNGRGVSLVTPIYNPTAQIYVDGVLAETLGTGTSTPGPFGGSASPADESFAIAADSDVQPKLQWRGGGFAYFHLGMNVVQGAVIDEAVAVPMTPFASLANQLFMAGLAKLVQSREIPTEWSATSLELAEFFGNGEPYLKKGGTVLVKTKSRPVTDERFRLMHVRRSLVDPRASEFTFRTRHEGAAMWLDRKLRAASAPATIEGALVFAPEDL